VRRPRLASPRRQRGIALMIAILLVAFATILAAAIGFKSAMSARRGSATLALDQSVLIAEAAEALAAYALREDRKAGNTIDFPGEAWGQPLGPVEVVPGIVLEAYVEDASGRFNLNSLIGQDGKVDQGSLKELESLMEHVDVEPKWASMIADWIDEDSQPLPDGAEDSAYATQDPPYRAANTFITSPSELLALPGFGRDRYLKLAPLVTALPPGAKINVCSASPVVLDAMVGETHREFSTDLQQFAKTRESGCFPTLDDYRKSFGGDTDALNRINNRVSQTSDYYRLTSIVTIGSADFNLYSLLQRDGNGQVHVLMRSFTPD
jgi:general secretion pathway protein K